MAGAVGARRAQMNTAADWLARWEDQQAGGVGFREERFTALVAAVAAVCGAHPRVLDLGCGPGSVADRVLRELPAAHVVGVDADPVLIELGRRTHVGDPRVSFVDLDLTDGGWTARLPAARFDAVTSTTALHWLTAAQLAAVYRDAASLLAPGGLLLNGDVLAFADPEPGLAAAARAIRAAMARTAAAPAVDHRRAGEPSEPVGAGETWEQWWAAIEAEPGFADAVAERRRRAYAHPQHAHVPYREHVQALRAAGFRQVGTLWQLGENRLLAAIR